MLLLPKTIGPITLVSKLGTGGVAESYRGTLKARLKRRREASVAVCDARPGTLQAGLSNECGICFQSTTLSW